MVGVKMTMKHLSALFCKEILFRLCLQEIECLVGFCVILATISFLHLFLSFSSLLAS